MKNIKELFGLEEIRLSQLEQVELQKKLQEINQNRIELLAFVSLVISVIFISIDLTSYYESFKFVYLFFDIVLFTVSFTLLIDTFKRGLLSKYTSFHTSLLWAYPIICIIWAAGIATLNPTSMMNLITYYLTFFILTFFLDLNKWKFFTYTTSVVLVYGVLCIILDNAIFSETFTLLIVGALITAPFFTTFNITRKNSLGALIRLNKSNQSLENEVGLKMNQLKVANEDLNNEISHRKMIELKLRDALLMAETSDKLKSEFLANISHEIRTPLNSIIGFTEMLTEEGVNHDQKIEFQKLVATNTMYLLSTIDDIFDASFINTDQINAIISPLKINKLLDNIFYETTGIALKYNSPDLEFIPIKLDDDDLELSSDEFYLKKALLRIIDNAYKFTTTGSITVGAKFRNSNLEFFVKDTGIGINQADRDQIFEPFVQVDGSFTRDFGGSGLGLSIVKGIIEELKCKLHLDSKKGKGSTFSLVFDQSALIKSDKK